MILLRSLVDQHKQYSVVMRQNNDFWKPIEEKDIGRFFFDGKSQKFKVCHTLKYF